MLAWDIVNDVFLLLKGWWFFKLFIYRKNR
jgi:hypothetical protein